MLHNIQILRAVMHRALFRALPERLAPELVVRVGDMVTSKAVRQWLAANRDCRQAVIDPDGAWNEPTWTADLLARADPGYPDHG